MVSERDSRSTGGSSGLLSVSSNMYSHVLAAYQKTLLVFWGKTSKTMSAVAESFKGYQYYEFTVIKDLAEPSRLLAEMNSSAFTEEKKKPKKTDDTLIDLEKSNDDQLQEQTAKSSAISGNGKQTRSRRSRSPLNCFI